LLTLHIASSSSKQLKSKPNIEKDDQNSKLSKKKGGKEKEKI
jgi:hypothetical protein